MCQLVTFYIQQDAGKDPAPLSLFSNVIFALCSVELGPCSCQLPASWRLGESLPEWNTDPGWMRFFNLLAFLNCISGLFFMYLLRFGPAWSVWLRAELNISCCFLG